MTVKRAYVSIVLPLTQRTAELARFIRRKASTSVSILIVSVKEKGGPRHLNPDSLSPPTSRPVKLKKW